MPLRVSPVYVSSVTVPSTPASVPLRPPPPPFRLPRSRRRSGGAVVSLVLHGLLLVLLVRHGTQWMAGPGAGAAGTRGGGGGSEEAVRFVQLPGLSAPREVAVSPAVPPPVIVPPLPVPEPMKLDVPPVDVTLTAAPVAVSGAATSGASGVGPGSGSGAGGGAGPGVGSDSGSGRGGDGEYISLPNPRTVIMPADCARGRFVVRFWVEADGRVSQVTVDPLPKDGGCQREMFDRMRGYRFDPALTRDGRPVAGVFQVSMQR